MVPQSVVLSIVVTLAASVLLPVAAAVIIKKKTGASLSSFFVGFLVFFVCYIIALAASLLFSSLIRSAVPLLLVSALRAGVVEESGRALAFGLLLKKKDRIADALMYGAGHGGIEVLLILTLTMFSNLVLALMANSGGLETILASAPEQAEALTDAIGVLAALRPGDLALGVIERISAMGIHICLSVVVFYAVRKKCVLSFLIAVALHAAVDFSLVFAVLGIVGNLAIEGILFAETLVLVLIAVIYAKRYNRPQPPVPADGPGTDADAT